jgi:hypothetical protein
MKESNDTELAARRLVDERVREVARQIGRPLPPHPAPVTSAPRTRDYLLDEARELYSNELRWEQETEEEQTASGELIEMVFPAFLALVDALVQRHGEEPETHRDVVLEILVWLAGRVITLRSRRPSPTPRVQEVLLADRLLDLVLYRYLELDPLEVETVDAGRG